MKSSEYVKVDRLLCAMAIAVSTILGGEVLGATDPSLEVRMTRSNQDSVLSWVTLYGVQYQVEAGSTFSEWTNLSPVMTGTGAALSFTNSQTGPGQKFFRVKRLFPAAPGTAVFDPATGVLTIVADNLHNVINVANDGTGTITVNAGAIPVMGGPATTVNTVLIQVLGSPGNDQITIGSGLPPAHLFGAEGADTLTGGSSSDMLVGGPGSDVLAGGLGNDLIYPDGDDTVIWNPGSGSDVVQGSGANNTLVFNGANVSENIVLAANGSRLRLTRDVASIVLDVSGVQTINVQALGGADNVTVGSLVGTDVVQVNVDLAASGGGGDAAADTVIINGTPAADTFNVTANGAAVEVTGLGALVRVVNAELANDRIVVSGVGGDRVNVNGTAGADTMQVVVSPVAGYVRATASGFTVPLDVNGALTLSVNGLGGSDSITAGNGLAALGVPLILDGGEGDDSIAGGDASETIIGGPGSDVLAGGLGNDLIYPDGNDTVIWNPGSGSDVVEGSGTNNTLVFNGANIGENIALTANGSRLRLTRDVATIVLDVSGVQTVNINALGGADNLVVNDLAGTEVKQVNIDLAAVVGTTNGDAQADTVTISGTTGADTFDVAANGAAVEVTGLGALVRVANAELANDRIVMNGVGGDRVNVNGTAGADTMQVVASPVTGYVRATASGFTAPVDVSGALTLSINGLGGPDVITAGNGLATLGVPLILDGGEGDDTIAGGDAGETIIGGAGNDVVSGGRGNDLVFLGDGNDTFTWNPGDGNDTVEGEGGSNTLVFNGANIGENIALTANGSRLRLTRDVATIVMDVNGVQTVNINALGGADNLVVNDLAGTDVAQVNIDLAASGGAGDAAADTVTVNGTTAPDVINITAFAGLVQVTGLTAQVQIAHPEPGIDTLVVNGLGGTDTITVGPGVTSLINVTANQ